VVELGPVGDDDPVVAERGLGGEVARRQRRGGESLDGVLQTLADVGELTRPSLPKGSWTWKTRGLGLPEGTARSLLDEVRDERLTT